MKNIERYIILFFFLSLTDISWSQIICTVPESPQLTLVSVDPLSGNVNINWDLSPSSGIAGYVIYKFSDGVGIPVDTIWNPLATSYTHITPATRYFTVSYVVAAHRRPNCISPLSNHLNTIFAEAKIDTCNKIITISWNRYLSEPKNVTGYKLSLSVNGGPFSEIAEVTPDSLKFIMRDFETDSEYCFIVTARLEGGKIAESNKVCLSTAMQRPPDWINADYATVNGNKISLSFTSDPFSEISSFSLERKTGNSGSFTEIARPVSTSGAIKFIDEKADIRSVNYYRLSAINSCNKPITISNTASNIVLTLERINSNVLLKWNHYRNWNGEIGIYNLYLNTGNGYSRIFEIASSDSSVLIDYKNIMYDITADKVCFNIGVEEISNPHGITGSSLSCEACTEPVENITVPDVFTPNNDLINDLFKPVLSFTPVEYIMIISNRQGKTIFETRNHNVSWDGTYEGDPLPQGIYLWSLRVLTPSGKTITKTGTIAVYFNR
ncbi:MAG: gliding motility-associated C-terminal domain-containing protein [Bacteroidetes bacterium]|nr:gliding motility-associated C-terminal domain-containing protein [Bacteroidota bacterium]